MLAGLQELLRPRVIPGGRDAFAPAKLGDRGLAARAVEHNTDLLFGRAALPVARWMLRTSVSDDAGSSLLKGYDKPKILRFSSRQFGLTGVEAETSSRVWCPT
jgi:hypothetical protein